MRLMPLFETHFKNRRDAGEQLAKRVAHYQNALVLALPRGGVPVAFEMAGALKLPLDVFMVRKLGVPGQEELALGAVASGGVTIFNEDLKQRFALPESTISALIEKEKRELERRETRYRGERQTLKVAGKTVLLVDDGLATGASMRAAVAALKQKNPATLSVYVPLAPADTCAALRSEVDELICLHTPHPFYNVGRWYDDFRQTNDEEVARLLQAAQLD